MNSNKGRSNYRTKMASLKINGKHYSLCEGINTIGRCITATVPLKHMDISKQHAIITIVNENQHYVTDFQSFNGTVMSDSKLQPLVLYELSEGCSIQFGNVNAVYHKIPTVSQAQQHGHDYSASSIESTQNSQFITQTFYDGATQALDNDTSVSHEPHEIEHPQNYFDDDYNFAEVSTQLSPPTLPTNPSKPLSIHDMPTQLFCEDVQESVVVTSDDKNIDQQPIVGKGTTELCEDIHEMETQIDDNLSIHNMPTQLISSNKDIHDMVTQPLDGSSINNMPTQLNTKHQDVDKGIHQTVTEPLNSSSIHNVTSDSNNQDSKDIHETVTQPIDRSSIYNMPTQLTKNTNNVSLNSTSVIDETINLSDIHEEAIKTQSSDSELQVNQLRRRTIRSIGDDSETSDKESESEEVVKCKMRKKAKILESESETDAEEDMLNVKLDLATYKRETKMDSGSETDIEDLVMETKTDDKGSCPVPDEPVKLSAVENDVASIGSDTDIDDFEINTQADTSNLNEDEDDYIIPATQCDNTDLEFQDDNKTSEEKEDVNKMADSVEMDSLYLEPTQPILNDDVFLEPPVPVTAVSEKKPVTKNPYNISITDDEIFIRPTQPVVQCIEYDPIFEQATQPITFEQQTKSKKNLNSEQVTDLQSDAIFMQPTQPIVDISMEDVKPVDSSLDDIFIQPTQPIQIPSKDMLPPTFTGINKISGTEKQKVDSPVDAIFMAPTQVIHTQEDIFEQSTQIVSDQKLRADNIEERLEDMFASQRPPEKLPQIESQLEVIFDSQNFGIDINNSRPSNPLVTELEGRLKDKETSATTTIESSIIDEGKSSRRKTPPSSVKIVATDKVKNYSVELLDRISMSLHENKEKSGYDSISVETKGAIEDHEADRRNNESSVDELISISSSKPNRKRTVTQKPSMKTEMVKNKVEDEPKLEMTEKTKETRRRNNETAVDECISISTSKLNRKQAVTKKLSEEKEMVKNKVEDEQKLEMTEETRRRNNETAVDESVSISTSKPNRKRTVTKKLSEETEVVKNKVEDKQKLEMTEKTEETRRRNNETAVDECISISTSRPNRKRAVTKKLSEETEVVKNKVEDEQKLEMTEKRKETRRRNNETAVDESVSISTSKPNRKGAVTKKLSEETEIVKNKVEDEQKLEMTEKANEMAQTKMRATRRTDKKLAPLSASSVDTATATSVNITKRKPVQKEPQFEENKNKCIELDSDSESSIERPSTAPLPVITKEVPKRWTRAKNTNDEQASVKEDSKPNVSSRVNRKLPLKKNQSKGVEKYDSLIEKSDNPSNLQVTEIQSNIPAGDKKTKETKSTTTSKRKSENETGQEMASDVEETKRPRRNITVPKKFLENEGSASSISVNTRRANTTRNRVSSETSDSESTGSVTKSSKNIKGKSSEADITTSTSESEQHMSASTRKGGRGKRVLSVGNTSNVPNKKQKPTLSDSDEFIPPTPSRGRRLNSTISESTPERNKRALKPKVVFTMLDNPDLESVIRRLGGRVVDSVEGCTVLVTGNLKRSQKLLTAVGQSKPICSPDWILECKKANKFLDPWDYILQDKEAEDKWKLSLKESLNRSRDHRLLEGYVVYLTVTSAIDVLKGAIESCGGKCVLKAPPKSTGNLIVVANAENKAKYSKFLKQSPPVDVVLPEAIFDGVLRQELRLGDHLLK